MENKNEQAYPVQSGDYGIKNGLTKRELFAAMAMQGILSNSDPQCVSMTEEKISILAAKHADALLLELEK